MTPEELKKAVEELNRLTVELRAKAEEAEKRGELNGASFKSFEEKINARMSEIDSKLNRAAGVGGSSDEERANAESSLKTKKAFDNLMRKGVSSLSPEEVKLLSVADSAQGGYLVLPEWEMEIIKDLSEISPIRQVARVTSIGSKALEIPKRTGLATAGWVAELDSSATGNSSYGLEEIPAHGLSVETAATRDQLQDSQWNMEAEIRADVVENMDQVEGAGFVTGNGVKKPEGFIFRAGVSGSGVNVITSAGAGVITFDDVIDLIYGVKTQYARNGTVLISRGVLKFVRKLKDSQGRYLWEPSQQAGQPSSIEGKPVVEVPDMAQSVATGSHVIAFGDWNAAYRIVDRMGMDLVRDDVTQASKRLVRFIFNRRVGGQVVQPAAYATLKVL